MTRKISDVRKQLIDISSHIFACAIALKMPEVPAPDEGGPVDPQYKYELQELIARLDDLSKDIAAHQSMANAQKWNFKRGSEGRWKVGQKEREANALGEMANAEKEFALKLLDTEPPKSVMAKGKSIIDLAEEIDKGRAEFGAQKQIAITHYPAYIPALPEKSEVIKSSATVVVTFVLFAKWWMDRGKKKVKLESRS